jgi:hypothetical protein
MAMAFGTVRDKWLEAGDVLKENVANVVHHRLLLLAAG